MCNASRTALHAQQGSIRRSSCKRTLLCTSLPSLLSAVLQALNCTGMQCNACCCHTLTTRFRRTQSVCHTQSWPLIHDSSSRWQVLQQLSRVCRASEAQHHEVRYLTLAQRYLLFHTQSCSLEGLKVQSVQLDARQLLQAPVHVLLLAFQVQSQLRCRQKPQ